MSIFIYRSSGNENDVKFKNAFFNLAEWRIVNDDVMGGISRSSFNLMDKHYRFSGKLSLENNGGFASIQSPKTAYDLSPFTGVAVRVKGDGHVYGLSLRLSKFFTGLYYRAKFPTVKDKWQEIKIPFVHFKPMYFGEVMEDAPSLALDSVKGLSLLISDKQEGPFYLEIEWIKVYRSS
jgi:monofunctional biosynthetic peptidoglycan transglycosylase